MDNRDGARIQSMFDRISPRYDLLNRIISGGRDLKWRRRAVAMLGDLDGKTALDICCGSGDFIQIFRDRYDSRMALYGIDFSAKMLDLARIRFAADKNLRLLLGRADAMSLPFADASIVAITIGFGIRNVADRDAALRETFRVLKPGGRIVMIEPASPPNRLVRALFKFYFKYISPLIGGLISGDRAAYRYLHDSFVAFPAPEIFLDQMKNAGYTVVRAHPQFFGTAMIYFGEKSAKM
jgi:demethylmenaquinone methyltransferase/2-methoxy-6-polyprenyl-1,4-benzoquinol methylase